MNMKRYEDDFSLVAQSLNQSHSNSHLIMQLFLWNNKIMVFLLGEMLLDILIKWFLINASFSKRRWSSLSSRFSDFSNLIFCLILFNVLIYHLNSDGFQIVSLHHSSFLDSDWINMIVYMQLGLDCHLLTISRMHFNGNL